MLIKRACPILRLQSTTSAFRDLVLLEVDQGSKIFLENICQEISQKLNMNILLNKKNRKIVFAYVSEHYISLGTKNSFFGKTFLAHGTITPGTGNHSNRYLA